METVLTLADAVARQVLMTLQHSATTTWTWLVAQPAWVNAALVLPATVMVVTGIVWVGHRHHMERATGMRTRVTPEAAKASRADGPAPRRARFTPSVSASEARELVLHGVPAIEISRRTGLSRDAVSLLLSQTGRRDQQSRPGPAGYSRHST